MRQSTSSIFTWVKLQSSSSSQARRLWLWCQWWRRRWQQAALLGLFLHWGQHQDVLSNGCATAWTVYSISCVCRSKQNQTPFCLVAWGRRLLYVYFSRFKKKKLFWLCCTRKSLPASLFFSYFFFLSLHKIKALNKRQGGLRKRTRSGGGAKTAATSPCRLLLGRAWEAAGGQREAQQGEEQKGGWGAL